MPGFIASNLDKQQKTIPGRLCSLGYSSQSHISRNPILPWHPFGLSNHFEILHRVRQYHCRALYKMSKLLGKWQKLWANEIARDLDLWWVSDGYSILQSAPISDKTSYPKISLKSLEPRNLCLESDDRSDIWQVSDNHSCFSGLVWWKSRWSWCDFWRPTE